MNSPKPLTPENLTHRHRWQLIKEAFEFKGGPIVDSYKHMLRFGCTCGSVEVIPAVVVNDDQA